MKNVLSIKNMRDSDLNRLKTISEVDLVYQAASAIYNAINWNGNILIVAGTGNNGADSYALANILKDNGYNNINIFIPKFKFSNSGKYYYDLSQKNKIKAIIDDYNNIDFNSYDIIVDGIFGTGFRNEVLSPYKEVIELINNSKAYIISVDINSGLNGDTGLCDIAIKSDITLAISDLKPGYFLNAAKDYINNIKVLDIGIKPVYKPYKLLEKEDLIELFPKRLNNTNKGSYGYTALIGGSIPYSGAIRLAYMANSAMYSGCGVLMLAMPKVLANIIIPNILEATIYPLKSNDLYYEFDKLEINKLMNRVKVIALGMGLGDSIETEKLVKYLLLNYDKTLILDADALNALSRLDNELLNNSKANIIITPHLKEFSRLTGLSIDEIKNDSINIAMEYAKKHNVIVLLKGPSTIVTDGDEVYLSNTGTGGMATAGSGDVLSGILASIASYNENLLLSTIGAAYINGLAGEYAEKENSDVTMLASDTVKNVKKVVEEIISLRNNL